MNGEDHSKDTIWDYLAQRLIEPSTYVSLGVLVTGLGFAIAPEKWQAISSIAMGLGGFLGVVLRERKKTTTAEIKEVVKDVVVPQAVTPSERPFPIPDTAMGPGSKL